jgi:hypothetical protein
MPKAGEGSSPHVGFAPGLTNGRALPPFSPSAAFALPCPDALKPSPNRSALRGLLCQRTPAHNTHQRVRSLAGGPGPIGAGLWASVDA